MPELQPIQEATVRGRSITGGYPADGRFTVEDVRVAHGLAIAMLADRRVKTGVQPGLTKNGNPFFVLAVEDESGAQDFAKVVGDIVTRALRIVAEDDAESARQLYARVLDSILRLADARLQGAYGFAEEDAVISDVDLDSGLRRALGILAVLRPWLSTKVDHVPLLVWDLSTRRAPDSRVA